jgi:nitrate reductase gamma subunit
METWLAWARGPAFWFALTFFVLGLIRHVGLTIWEINRAVMRAGDKVIPYKVLAIATFKWLLPIEKVSKRWAYSVTTLAFHVSILIAPLFLAGHIALIARGIGISWPAIPNALANLLTVIAIVTAIALVVERLAASDSRALSHPYDYAMPILVSLPFITGLLLARPALRPFSFETAFFLHVMSANLLLVLIPLTKLNHCVLMPTGQIVSEVSWHFTPDAGRKIAFDLGKENEPV